MWYHEFLISALELTWMSILTLWPLYFQEISPCFPLERRLDVVYRYSYWVWVRICVTHASRSCSSKRVVHLTMFVGAALLCIWLLITCWQHTWLFEMLYVQEKNKVHIKLAVDSSLGVSYKKTYICTFCMRFPSWRETLNFICVLCSVWADGIGNFLFSVCYIFWNGDLYILPLLLLPWIRLILFHLFVERPPVSPWLAFDCFDILLSCCGSEAWTVTSRGESILLIYSVVLKFPNCMYEYIWYTFTLLMFTQLHGLCFFWGKQNANWRFSCG
jgi:hypothetical protein